MYIHSPKYCALSPLNYKPLKLVNHFAYLGCNISSTENDANTLVIKACIPIKGLLIKWLSNLPSKIKWNSSIDAPVLLYGCIT